MKTHLPWIRISAAAVAAATYVGGAGALPVAAQYAPYQPAASQAAAQTPYSAYRPQAQYPQYQAPATAYPQTAATAYPPPTAAQYSPTTPAYPQTVAQYPNTYGAYPYVAQQPSATTLPAPKQPNTSAARPSTAMPSSAMKGNMPAAEGMSAAQPGCGCNGAMTYGAGDYYGAQGCGCTGSNGYPDCSAIGSYMGNESCNENQWFGGVYFLEMGRTNAAPVKLTAQIPAGGPYPYYPPSTTTVLDARDVNFDFREGVEVRFGSTFSIGEPCSACDACSHGYGLSNNGCNGGCGCGCPTTYAWEFAWWGLDNQPSTETVVYDGTNRLVGMKSFVGAQYDFTGAGNVPVNNFYRYELPVPAVPTGAYPVLAQRVRTDFQAQNLELNVMRFPMTCGGCNSGCGGCDSCGCNGGCGDKCGLGFSMYGSCGVRYLHLDDSFTYSDEFESGAHTAFDGFTYDNPYELAYDVQVKNNLIGPQLGWTSDYCYGKWSLFLNSTFGIFDNHMTATQRMWSGGGDAVTLGDGSTFNVRSNKDAVAFLGELRVGAGYDISCHWRGVVAYRAVAITGLATSTAQMDNDYMDHGTVAIIDSDNSTIIHGAQVGAECRY